MKNLRVIDVFDSKNVKNVMTAVWIAVLLFMLYAFYVAGLGTNNVGIVSFMVALSLALFIRFRRMKGMDLKKDERTVKLSAYAATYSWYFVFMTVIVFYWVDYAALYPLSVSFVSGFLMMEMALSVAFFKWLLLRQGDVE